MKILRLKTAVVEGNFDWTFVRVETDEGIKGLGECFFAPGLTSILRSLEPLLIGEDARDIHRLFRKLQLATSGAGSVAGIVYNAISGIEAALGMSLASGSMFPSTACWVESFEIKFESMPIVTAVRRWKAWTKYSGRARHRGIREHRNIPHTTTLARPGKKLHLRRTNIAAARLRKERKDLRL
jgi:hypothetical protein